MPHKYRDIEIHGKVYRDANHAAEAFGVTPNHIRKALLRGRLDGIGRGRGESPVTIRGVRYPSCAAAGRAFGVTGESVARSRDRGTLDRVGLGLRGARPTPVRIDGRDFESARAAAEFYGRTVPAVWAALEAGDPDRIARNARYNGGSSKPFSVGPLRFPSMAAACRALGFANETYIAQVIHTNSKRGRERILAAAQAYLARSESA